MKVCVSFFLVTFCGLFSFLDFFLLVRFSWASFAWVSFFWLAVVCSLKVSVRLKIVEGSL